MNNMEMDPSTIGNTASILVNNLANVLNERKSTPDSLESALKPFDVTQWALSVINHVAADKINRLFGRSKRPPPYRQGNTSLCD